MCPAKPRYVVLRDHISPTNSLLLLSPPPPAFATAIDVMTPFCSVTSTLLPMVWIPVLVHFFFWSAAAAEALGTTEKLTGRLRSSARLRMGPGTFENWSMCHLCVATSPSPSFSSEDRWPLFLSAFSLYQSWLRCSKYSGDTSNISSFYGTQKSRQHSCQKGQQESAFLHIIFLFLPRAVLLLIGLNNTTLFLYKFGSGSNMNGTLHRGEVVSLSVSASIWWYYMKIYVSHFPCTQSQFRCCWTIIMETLLGEQTTPQLYLGFHMTNFLKCATNTVILIAFSLQWRVLYFWRMYLFVIILASSIGGIPCNFILHKQLKTTHNILFNFRFIYAITITFSGHCTTSTYIPACTRGAVNNSQLLLTLDTGW